MSKLTDSSRPSPNSPQPRDFTAGYADDEAESSSREESGEELGFQAKIKSLLRDWDSKGRKDRYIAELINEVLRLRKDDSAELDLKIITKAFKELRYANSVFASYRTTRKVSVFGSARTNPDEPEYKAALEFSRRLVEEGFMIITGAGPGIMAAGNEGAGEGESFGLRIQLPFEAGANEFITGDDKLINFRYFFTRKLSFVKEADAIALFPGGFGTMDEGFESMTLIQTGKAELFPIVMVDAPGGSYWKSFYQFIKEHLLRLGLISDEDLNLFKVTDSVDEAVDEILQFYRVFHSYRYVGDDLYIRLNHGISEEAIEKLNDEHADILVKGSYRLGEPHAAERTEPALLEMPRLICTPQRSHYGKLRKMIDALNESETR
ncbi:MAG: TIGR00730 family Rossman fold protein [Verrucomicrobiota bacterium]